MSRPTAPEQPPTTRPERGAVAAEAGEGRLLRLALRLPGGDPWRLLERGPAPRFAWSRPEGGGSFLALGCLAEGQFPGEAPLTRAAALCSAWAEHMEELGGDAPGGADLPLAVGGFAFPAARPPAGAAWRGWPAARVWLPRVLVARDPDGEGGEVRAVLQGWARERAALRAEAQALRARWEEALGRPAPRPGEQAELALQPGEGMDRDSWARSVEAALAAFARGELAKAVLARGVCLQAGAGRRFDPLATLRLLRERHPDRLTFSVEGAGRGGGQFLGSTPELLLRVAGALVETHALAGTAPRSDDPAEDARLGAALLQSAKDRREHGWVVEALTRALGPRCAELEVPAAPRLARLRGVQHLETPLRGRLRTPASALALAGELLPTPAVGGWPLEPALAWLAAHEPLERGWYAGAVGWVGADGRGEWAVPLRSALLRGARAWAFAGAGLVPGSDPDAEWRETQLKLETIRGALVTCAEEAR